MDKLLARGFWQNCSPEKILSGRKPVLYFSLLDPLRSIKRKTVGEFVRWRGYTSLREAVTCTLTRSPGKVELGRGGHEHCTQCFFLQWPPLPNGDMYGGGGRGEVGWRGGSVSVKCACEGEGNELAVFPQRMRVLGAEGCGL